MLSWTMDWLWPYHCMDTGQWKTVAIYLEGKGGGGAGGAQEYSTSEIDSPFLGFLCVTIRMVNAKN